jgi:hypothetical protein
VTNWKYSFPLLLGKFFRKTSLTPDAPGHILPRLLFRHDQMATAAIVLCRSAAEWDDFPPADALACLPFDLIINKMRPIMPSRIQRQRSRGWRQPIDAIYVGRPTKWGNPHKVGAGYHTADEAADLYRRDLIARSLPFTVDDVRRELKGKDLVCWCKPGTPCHADVLLALANGGRRGRPAVRTAGSTGGSER